jgi:uncharacterized glyoxalase superfamily protein PhnB
MAKKAKTSKPTRATAPAKKPVRKAARRPVARAAAAKQTRGTRARSAPARGGSSLVSIAAGFTANDAAASIKWYRDVLGFTVKERWEHEGQFRGAQIGSGGVTINIGQDDWKMGRDRVKGQGTRMYIMMGPDIDQYASAIKARGGLLDQDVSDGWGMRAFSINDPDGFKLTFMTPAKA